MSTGQVSSIEDDAQYRVDMIVAAYRDTSIEDNARITVQAQHQLDEITVYSHALDEKINELSGLLHWLQEEREQAGHLANALAEVIHRSNKETQEIDRVFTTPNGGTITVPNDGRTLVRY